MRLAVVVAVLAGVVVACGGGGSGAKASTPLRFDLVPGAVRAVEAARGGPQRYSEINVTPDGVNLFVLVSDTEEVAYFATEAGLGEPGPKQAKGGEPFTLDGVALDIGHRLALDTQAKLPGSEVVQASIVTTPDHGVVWGLKSKSPKGGILNVLYSPQGALLSVLPE